MTPVLFTQVCIEQDSKTNTEGIFVCGCVQSPKDIGDSVSQASATAGKAANMLCRDMIELEPTTCEVNPDFCRACNTCVSICDFHAPELVERSPGVKVARINEALCKGCGTCAAWCPTDAIIAKHFTDQQIESMMETMLLDKLVAQDIWIIKKVLEYWVEIERIIQKIEHNEYEISLHAEKERRDEDISLADIESAIRRGKILEDYPNDPSGPSCLLLGHSKGKPIHIVCGWTQSNKLRIITVYLPKFPKWIDDETRRHQEKDYV